MQEPAAPPPRAPWTPRDLALGVAFLLLGYAVVVGAVILLARRGDPDTDESISLGVAIVTLGFSIWLAALVLILADRRGLTLTQLGFGRVSWWWPLATVFGAWGILLAYAIAVQVIERATGADLSRLQEGNALSDSEGMTDLVWFVLGLAVVVAAPFGEELFFRGFLFPGFRRVIGLLGALLLSGALFALVHFEVSVVLPFWGIGIWFAWAVYRSGSLWTSILAHAIFNGVSFAVTIGGMSS